MATKGKMKLHNNFVFNQNNYKILIIEDSKSLNNILFNTFTEEKYNTFRSFNLKDALNIIKENRIDFIILDEYLPDGNSYEFVKKLKNSEEKIFILKSELENESNNLFYQKSIVDYIYKDRDFFYNIKDVFKTIEQLEKNRFKTILIMNDSINDAKELKNILENRSYIIKTTSNTQEAKKIIDDEIIDLILLDIELKNGLDFIKINKREILKEKKIPVLILSEDISSVKKRESLKIGAVDFMSKPIISEEVISKIDLWIDYKRKKEEIIESKQLLKQYKYAVDENSIVSKTDKYGRITYVNDNFCDISGYEREELIGKNHNLVKNNDMSSVFYKELWHSIKVLKKSWTGNIKNTKKDGSVYWVKATIKPIINKEGEILEYIAIRTDISEDIQVKKYFEEKLNNTKHSLKDAINLSQSYEMAINESNMLSRLDLDFKYTYVNDKFCELTSFSRNELIGKKHSVIIHKDINSSIINDIQNRLKDDNIWNGIVYNKSKNNKEYWVNVTALPIKDQDGKTIEYIIIRQDVTELFELHKDIEETQREIIYRMGEVGESRSKETGNHVKRVAQYSKELALLVGLGDKESQVLFTASPMHDIGKVGIADNILKKTGKLNSDEFEIMKTHSEIGFNILKGSNKPILEAAAIVALTHHEKWDGSGYPHALKGEDIHIFGRITAVADVFDALGSDRIYKKAWKDEDIFKLFKEEKGKHFDPKLISIFMDNLDVFLNIRDCYTD